MEHEEGLTVYVSTDGSDRWSGLRAEPDAAGTDGPLATLDRARELVREHKLSGNLSQPVHVLLRGGDYAISEPLRFGPDDSGPITYAAYPGETPVITGALRIDGWQEEDIDGRLLWVADVPEVAAGRWYFHQLFVNGGRRRRARLPKDGFFRMEDVPGTDFTAPLFAGADTFRSAPGDIQPWRNLDDVEVVVLHFWIEERMPIASFDPATRLVTSPRRSVFALKDDIAQHYARYYVENVFEALSEPGEWYLDRTTGRLYYCPLPDESIDTLDARVPRTTQLLRIEGEPADNRLVEFLRFRGISFQHTEWERPTGTSDLVDDSDDPTRRLPPGTELAAAPQAACDIPGALVLTGARYCTIEDCTISHSGGYGIELANGCLANRIVGNELFDLGAGGVKLNGSGADGPPHDRTGNNRVTDNHIHAGGRVFASAVGVLSGHSFGNEISHNHIHDLYYTGISCGWVWGYADNVSKNNRITKNHIHHLGQGALSDMGGIYTLGVQPGTVLRHNLIHDVEKRNYGGWGIYLDEGSSHILVEGNVCYRTTSQLFNQHYGRENVVRNNVFAFGGEGQCSLSRVEEHNSFTFTHNVVVSDGQPMFVGGYAGHLGRRGFRSDVNLFWDLTGKPPISGDAKPDKDANWSLFRVYEPDQWKHLGYDRHSTVADPRLRDPANGDFTPATDSPIFDLGLDVPELADVGPRAIENRQLP